jgi:anti-anti-sigma factor
MILSIEHKKIEPDVVVMELHGRITMGNDSQKIEWGVAQLLKESQKKVIFDLSDVCYVDSSGVGILMMCYAKVKKAGGRVVSGGSARNGGRSAGDDECEQDCTVVRDDCRGSEEFLNWVACGSWCRCGLSFRWRLVGCNDYSEV